MLRTLTQRVARQVGRRLQRFRIRGIPRIFYLSAPWVLGSGRRMLESVSGAVIDIDTREYADCMMFYGRYAPELIAIIQAAVREGDSVIDVGAQLGYITYQLARAVGPGGVVQSMEPDPRALERLTKLIAANLLTWVKVFPLAASDHAGAMAFGVSETLGWSTAVRGSHLTNLSPTTVESVRLDDLWKEGKIRRPVRFVKVDIEGHECEALAGMSELLKQDRPLVVAEINTALLTASGRSGRDVLTSIGRHNYRLYRISGRRGVVAGGTTNLEAIGPNSEIESCDVLGVPREAELPRSRSIHVA